ncbi:DUF4913 domain-containing protein [Rathayibacter sp. Leaf299]|uniref:DUF4913 domain-containing protein n=1 Tax=Rathayibacter sp. Leaf299 TaxID=1736328 RepID=UPI0009E6E2F2|nr:DUF4913 domain-containing protein [Rathayibacter sp. Leaf299]
MDELEQQLQDAFVAWVSQRLSRIERRPNSWCPSWWAHPEAVDRLYALHQAWEKAQRHETLISWWNYDWAMQWPALTQPGGVLDGCTAFEHIDPVLPQMEFKDLPAGRDLELPFPPSGENLDDEDEDDAEVEKRLRAEREAEEEAMLAALADDDSS